MRFVRFGVTLEKLPPKYLEVVRRWRNSDLVRPNMRFREVISSTAQMRWFESLDPKTNWYFVAHTSDLPFALFHIRDIDHANRLGEAGGFVGDKASVGRPEAARATLALMDFAFFVLELRSLRAHYNPRMQQIAHFNQQLGYQVDWLEADGFVCSSVTADRYLQCAAPFRAAALEKHGTTAAIFEPDPSLARRLEELCRLTLVDFKLQL